MAAGEGEGDPGRAPGRPVDAGLGPAILRAVLDVLAEGGYSRLTTAAVARSAGVSTATLYRRWDSKRELLLAAARQIAEDEDAEADTGSLSGDVRALLKGKQRVLSGQLAQVVLILAGESAHDPELADVLRTGLLEPMQVRFAEMFARAASRGEPHSPVDAGLAARLVFGAILAGGMEGGAGSGSEGEGSPGAAAAGAHVLTDGDVRALAHILAPQDG